MITAATTHDQRLTASFTTLKHNDLKLSRNCRYLILVSRDLIPRKLRRPQMEQIDTEAADKRKTKPLNTIYKPKSLHEK